MHTLISLIVALSVFISASKANDLLVQTKYGLVEGYASKSARIWQGIPFASPPVGPLRWQLPTPPQPWNGVKRTTAYGNFCVQSFGGSEDCLYLNVYAPLKVSSNLPVLAFIYGGSFDSGMTDLYEGSYLAGDDVIVVTMNYRVGAFGFIAHPDLLAANHDNTTGFFGIQDQRFALEWIQDNIAAFGGDVTKVTLSGESAGAISVCTHLATPRSAGLFAQAIMESGFCKLAELSTGFDQGVTFATNLKCVGSSEEIVNCLYALSADSIYKISATMTFSGGIMNPYEIMSQPLELIESGQFNKVPLLGGTNLNESSFWYCPVDDNITANQYLSLLSTDYPQQASKLIELYPSSGYVTPVSALIAVTSDDWFKCPTRSLFDLYQHSPNNLPAYMYSFERAPAFVVAGLGACYGAAHAYELLFLWPSLLTFYGGALTPAEQVLSSEMRQAWINFVVNGTPAFLSGPDWPLYDPTNRPYTVLDLELHIDEGFRSVYCDFWNSLNGTIASGRL